MIGWEYSLSIWIFPFRSNWTQNEYISSYFLTFASRLASPFSRLDWRTLSKAWIRVLAMKRSKSASKIKWKQEDKWKQKHTCLLHPHFWGLVPLIPGQIHFQLTVHGGISLVEFLNLIEQFLDIATIHIIHIILASIKRVNLFINTGDMITQKTLPLLHMIQHGALQRFLIGCHLNHALHLSPYLSNFWSHEGVLQIGIYNLLLHCLHQCALKLHFPSFKVIKSCLNAGPIDPRLHH